MEMIELPVDFFGSIRMHIAEKSVFDLSGTGKIPFKLLLLILRFPLQIRQRIPVFLIIGLRGGFQNGIECLLLIKPSNCCRASL